MKLWQVHFRDLEMLLIGLQTLIQGIRDLKNSDKLQNFNSFIIAKPTKITDSLDGKNIGKMLVKI